MHWVQERAFTNYNTANWPAVKQKCDVTNLSISLERNSCLNQQNAQSSEFIRVKKLKIVRNNEEHCA